ncbi:PAS domain S-box protein [Microseira sp. BLCC-F43]|uniref:PAS domain-containing hybrid sensor histidine kinase/response regulator n=1 Tax=Microseira sp. BLCC-F43 TaxID=3153602 RepID=UPI0035BB928D
MKTVRVSNQTNLIDAGGDIGMVLQSADSTILACNPAAEQLLGYTAAQLIGTTSFDSLWQTTHPDQEYPARAALLSGKPCLNVVLGFYKPNGELIWLCLSSHPLFQADATTPYAVMTTFSAISEDELTCQKTADPQLAEIEAIYSTAPIGLCFIDTNLRFVRLNEHLAEINGIPVSEHIGRTLREILPEQADDLEPLLRQVIESGEPILNLEVSGTNLALPGVQRDWLVSYYPLKGACDRVLGVNAMVQEISDRKRTEAALRQQAQIINQIHDSVISTDLNGYIISWNQGAVRLFGYSAAEALGQHISLLYPTPQMQEVLQHQIIEPLLRQGGHEVEVQMQCQSGELIDALLSLSLLRDENQTPIGMIGYSMDISDRKRTEAALRASEARYRQLVELSPDGIFIQSGGKFEFVNPAALDLLGATESEQLIGKTVMDFIHPDYREIVKMRMQQLQQNQTVPLLEEKFLRLDGTIVEVEVAAAPLVYQGRPAVQAVIRHISDRKQAEAALAKQESRYRYIFEAVGVSIWEEDFSVVKVAIDELKASGVQDFRQYFAQHPEFVQWAVENVKLLNVNDITLQMCEAQTKEQVLASLNQIFLPETMDVFVGELLTIAAGETFFCAEAVVQTLHGNRLNVLVTLTFPPPHEPYDCVLVTWVDITARKQTAAALSQSEERFRQLANAMPQMVWTTDALGELNYVSQQWIDYSGLTLEQTRDGSHATEFMHPDEIPSTQAQWSAALASETTYQVEMRIRRASDDTYRWFLVRAVPIRDERGIVVQWYGTSTDIDARKQVEAALRQMNERFRLATLAIDGIVFEWNMQTGEVYRSEGLYQLIGVRAEDAAPTREWWIERIHPDDLARMESGMQSLESLGDRYEGEYRVRHADGRWIDVWERGCLRRDESGQIVGILGFTTDITKRKQAEITLRQSEERYRYLAESIPQLVWTANAEGALLDLNQRWLDFTGLTFPQAQTQGWEGIVHPDDLPILSENWAAAQKDGTLYQAEGRIRRADGMYRWHLHQAIALKDEQNQIVKWFGTATDIEDQKQLEQQRERLLQQEQVAREKAEQANRIKDEFLAVLSHELRTPLNPILGWTKLLQTGKVNATKTAEALTTIERNAKLQAQLIEDLLDVSRILRGKLNLKIAPVNLANAIAAALETVQLASQAKDIQIQTDLDPNVGMVAGDAARLQQIVWNLLSNAVKFTPQGGRVEVKLNKLQISDCRFQIERSTQIEQKNNSSNLQSEILNLKSNKSEISYAQIQVTDNGKGINTDFLPYVFEHFRQEDSAITRKFGGLGLGLAIVRQLVELHGGTVFAESQGEGTGSTFTVRLPLIKQQPENATHPARSEEFMTQSSPLAGLNILVVDDDADSRDFIAFVLEQDGAKVIALPSALQALREFPRAKPDVLVSDIGMPEMDGYMLMRQIRALPPDQGGKVPAIALTAYAGEGDSKQALSAGFQQHIAKPIEPNQLVQAVAKLAGKSSG